MLSSNFNTTVSGGEGLEGFGKLVDKSISNNCLEQDTVSLEFCEFESNRNGLAKSLLGASGLTYAGIRGWCGLRQGEEQRGSAYVLKDWMRKLVISQL